MTKARHEGPAYIHSLLTGYKAQPAELLKAFRMPRPRLASTTTPISRI
jgi:hypothetical protein